MLRISILLRLIRRNANLSCGDIMQRKMEKENNEQENDKSEKDSEKSESDEDIEKTEEIELEKLDKLSESSEESLDFGEFNEFVPSSRFNSGAAINPFLEQGSIEPVENLERDLSAQRTNPAEVQNAPQYSPSTGTLANSYEQPTDDAYPKIITPSPAGLPSSLSPNEMIGMRNQEDSSYPEEQKYKFASETSKRRREDW